MKKVIEHPQSMSVAALAMAVVSVVHPGFQLNPAVQAIIASVSMIVAGINHVHSVKAAVQIQNVLSALAASKPADAQTN